MIKKYNIHDIKTVEAGSNLTDDFEVREITT